LTLTALIVRQSPPALLLANPNPDTWNNWVLPYGSFSKLVDPPSENTLSFLTEWVHDQVQHHQSEYDDSAREDIKSNIGVDNIDIEDTILHEDFSLKYSESSKVWTIYRFAHHRADLGDSEVSAKHKWMTLDKKTIQKVQDDNTIDGTEVAGNVVELLGNRSLVNSLKS